MSSVIKDKYTTNRNKKRFRFIAKVQKGHLPSSRSDARPIPDSAPYLTMEYLRGEITEPTLVFLEPGVLVAKDGDLLLLWDGSNAGEFLHAKSGIVSSTLALITPISVDRPYFYWACKALEGYIRTETVGMGIPHVNSEFLANLRVPIPSLDTQRAIANYLDQETSRIDALISAKERLLKLLAEKRYALITRAVTRGLDPDVPLRNSGVSWLGSIVNTWRLVRAKYLFVQSSLPIRSEDEIVTCFRDGQVTLRKNRREEGFTNADLEVGYQGIRPGQLVLHSMDAFAGAIGVSNAAGKCSPEYIICDPIHNELDNNYYGLLLRIMALAGFIQASCPAVRERAPRIRFNDFGEMFLPVPSLDEQRSIVRYISSETTKLDAVRDATSRTVVLLKERRKVLIAAAVTGQIEVGEIA